MRHGTYGRKTPIPMRVARFDCRDCQTTISRLPDFAAARRRGSLQEIEDAMIVLATAPSRWAAARRLFPHRDELSNAIRDLCGVFAAVSVFLAAVATLRPDPFRGCPADLVSMRAGSSPVPSHSGTGGGRELRDGQTAMHRARVLFLSTAAGHGPFVPCP